jgi:hypothetical protein
VEKRKERTATYHARDKVLPEHLPYSIASGGDREALGKICELTAEARPLNSLDIILGRFSGIGKEGKRRALRVVRGRHKKGRKISKENKRRRRRAYSAITISRFVGFR